jgi:homospermidine synthase
MNVRRMTGRWSEPGCSAVVEHGANPGLISHWTKQGLIDIGRRLLEDKKINGADAEEIGQLIADRAFNRLAMKLGVKVIHCSERDTQITDRPKQVDEFVNTWSIEGFREEGTTTAEMGWGTHEKELPPLAYEHRRCGSNRWRGWESTPGCNPECRIITSAAWSCHGRPLPFPTSSRSGTAAGQSIG